MALDSAGRHVNTMRDFDRMKSEPALKELEARVAKLEKELARLREQLGLTGGIN